MTQTNFTAMFAYNDVCAFLTQTVHRKNGIIRFPSATSVNTLFTAINLKLVTNILRHSCS